ncbi:TPA: hypothetical protein HA246_04095 [Candidatus Woesearchaeota archaeon]|nr:hypothetical protein [Candidatus Woesearchaeota archaeon]
MADEPKFICDLFDLDIPSVFTIGSDERAQSRELDIVIAHSQLIGELKKRKVDSLYWQMILNKGTTRSAVAYDNRDYLLVPEYLGLVQAIEKFPDELKAWALKGLKVKVRNLDEFKQLPLKLQLLIYDVRGKYLKSKVNSIYAHHGYDHTSFLVTYSENRTEKSEPMLTFTLAKIVDERKKRQVSDDYLVVLFADASEGFFLSNLTCYKVLKALEEKMLLGSPRVPASNKRFAKYSISTLYRLDYKQEKESDAMGHTHMAEEITLN